ncbi:NERD domain-containing protein (plasmid) [Streptomyces chartreusis]|uniref:nuclease-related domain-containing protein n=1 Tax=Streptomyces chartreusis TaxID=1969 RepID=UPI003867F92B|nr:NERD domain-containing protein [Streptomyces chartreusis]
MTVFGNSAAREAAAIRARARRGLWRRVTAALGVSPSARRADAVAARWDRGAAGEAATAALVAQLLAHGWQIRHDVRLPGRRFNIDHILISPCGTAIVVLDTKAWHRGRDWPTLLLRGRVHCGTQDRHDQVVKVAGYAAAVQRALGLPGVTVWPLLVVHGSRIQGGRLEARVSGWDGVVHVLGPDWLVPTLLAAPKVRDPRRADAVLARVDSVLRPYGEGG